MNYDELLEINYGKPSKELINKFFKEEEGITFFYKHNLKKDKRPYWKGMILNSVLKQKRLIKRGKELYGNNFEPDRLTKDEIKEIELWNEKN